MPKQTAVGLDLAGNPKNPSGFAELCDDRLEICEKIDAAMAAVTGLLWLKKKVEEVGDPREGNIIIPRGPQALERA